MKLHVKVKFVVTCDYSKIKIKTRNQGKEIKKKSNNLKEIIHINLLTKLTLKNFLLKPNSYRISILKDHLLEKTFHC